MMLTWQTPSQTSTVKYAKHVIREPIYPTTTLGKQALHFCAEQTCLGAQHPGFPAECTMRIVTQAHVMVEKPHVHDSDQIIFFLGPNPTNLFEFDAEVELSLGEEEEKQIIDTPSIVYVPKGMIHCPLKFARVGKPVFFGQIGLFPQYATVVGDRTQAPHLHSREWTKYTPEEADKMRGRALRKT